MESHQLLKMVGSAVHLSCTAKLSAPQQQIQPWELQQVLLLPALLLRWAVHKQQHQGSQLDGMHCTLTAVVWSLRILPCWRRLVAKASKQQEQRQQLQRLLQGWHALQGQQGSTQLPAAVLYELLLLVTHLLQRVVDATPGFSTATAAQGYRLEDYELCRPEGALDALATALGALLPAATTMLLGDASTANTAAGMSANNGSSSSSGSSSSTSGPGSGSSSSRVQGGRAVSKEPDWAALLLRMLPALEGSMRIQALHNPGGSLSFLGRLSEFHPCGPTGMSAFILASRVGHAYTDILYEPQSASPSDTAATSQAKETPLFSTDDASSYPGLLQWLLSHVRPAQAATARQRVHSFLSTAIKQLRPPATVNNEAISLQLLRAIARTVWDVIETLDSPPSQGSAAAGMWSGPVAASLAAGCQAGRLAPPAGPGMEPPALSTDDPAAPTQASLACSTQTGSSSSSSAGTVRSESHAAAAGSAQVAPPAALPWIALLGRCWCLFAEHLSQLLLQGQPAARNASGRQQAQLQQSGGAGSSWPAFLDANQSVLLFTLVGRRILPYSIRYAATTFAASEQQELPTYRLLPNILGLSGVIAKDLAPVTEAQGQQLYRIGQQVVDYFRGFGSPKLVRQLQQESWALAEADAATGSCFLAASTRLFDPRFPPAVPHALAALLLYGMGIPEPEARQKAARLCPGGSCSATQAVVTALRDSPVIQAYCKQLAAAGMAFSSVPTAAACNNPGCRNMAGSSEQQAVGGKACRCAGCHLAYYCSRACQRQHWGIHKPVCKAVQAHNPQQAAKMT